MASISCRTDLDHQPSWTVDAEDAQLPEYSVNTAAGDVTLQNIMPKAEYMYGCTPTAMAMLLGYYDLYGIKGLDYSNIIEGSISVNSRGSDGNIYNMNEFNSVLGSFIASEDYVSRFYSVNGVETSPAHELQYSFVDGGSVTGHSIIDTSNWNCLADYLGTGQYWRTAENLATYFHYDMTLQDIITSQYTVTVSGAGTQRTIDWRYTNVLFGLNLYVESRGYSLDRQTTCTHRVDSQGGNFTFEDYMREIDAGRPVLISITGHSMVGYGYNESTREIIFDDTYEADQRMTWGSVYTYAGEARALQAITVISLLGGSKTDLIAPVLNGLPTATVNDFTVTITWEPATDNVAVAGYILRINSEEYSIPSGNSFSIDLANGSYTYSLLAYDHSENRSGWSQEQTFTVNFVDTVAPTLTGLPTVEIASQTATIRWEAAVDNVAVDGYVVRIGDREYTIRTTSFTLSLAPGHYSCSIRAFDTSGNFSDWSDARNFLILDPSIDVEAPKLNGPVTAKVGKDEVVFSWQAASDNFRVAGYLLKVDNQEYTVQGTSYALSLYPGAYTYQLRAFDDAGNLSDWSQLQTFRIEDYQAPEFSVFPRVTVKGGDVTIAWTEAIDNAGVKEYVVRLNGQEYSAGGDTSLTLTGRQPGDYTCQVKAVDYAGNTASSFSRNFTITAASDSRQAEFLAGRINHAETAFTWQLDLQPGLYTLSGDFSGLNATVFIVNPEDNRLIAKARVKNGVLDFRKSLLLDGRYQVYLASSDNAKTRGEFSFQLSGATFVRGDNRDDRFASLQAEHRLTVDQAAGTLIADEWVGYGDAVDYRQLTIQHAGQYFFDLAAAGAVKLTVYALQANGRLKAITRTSFKSAGDTGTKGALLTAGTYYLSIESTNAKKGGSSDYSVSLNNRSVFFTRGDNRDDYFASLQAEHRLTVDQAAGTLITDEWVGYGDAVDYRQLTIQHAGQYFFDLTAGDAVKLTVYALQANGKLKAITQSSLKSAGAAGAKGALLTAGTYYLAVESTNAKKGGSADYSVSLNSRSVFFTRGDNRDDSFSSLAADFKFDLDGSARKLADDNWVGYGDAVDYCELQFSRDGDYTFTLSDVTDTLRLNLFSESNGKLKKLSSLTVKEGSGTLTAADLSGSNRYFLAVESVNARQGGGSGYSLDVYGSFQQQLALGSSDLSFDSFPAAADSGISLPPTATELPLACCSAAELDLFQLPHNTPGGFGLLA